MSAKASFKEAGLYERPLRTLGLSLKGTLLEELIEQLLREMQQAGLKKLKPHFYLSTEWGVPFETVSIAIPFYLASPELTSLHADRAGHVEGYSKKDILRYLRHELGHVVNYAYKLYERKEWVEAFGAISQPYLEEYRPQPFSRRYVRHLPGWYAQKHPDEDWSESFAVWMTPGFDWKTEYAQWPSVLAKLQLVDRLIKEVRDKEPFVSAIDPDEDVGAIEASIDQLYADTPPDKDELPGVDGSLRTIFEDHEQLHLEKSAAALIRKVERDLIRDVYLWTGHFPEKTRRLTRHLAARAEALNLVYEAPHEARVIVGLTALVTALAMNHVHRGGYFI